MKIGILCHSFPPIIGGGETQAYLVAYGLSERGHDVTVITGDHVPKSNRDEILPFSLIKIPFFELFENGHASLKQFLPEVKKILMNGQFDVIHVHNFMPGLAFAILASTLKVKTVFTFHSTPIPSEGKILGHFNEMSLETAFTEFVIGLPFYEALVCPSMYYYNWAKRLGAPKNKLRLVYHGIDQKRFGFDVSKNLWRKSKGYGEDDYIIVCLARMIERKGIIDLVHAMHLIPDVKVKLFVGTSIRNRSTEYQQIVENTLDEFNLRSRVLIEYENDAIFEVPQILKSCDLLVLPSHIEGLGIALLEGMAAGLPVIGCNTVGINEVIKHEKNGLLVHIANPGSLAEGILQVYRNPSLQRKLRTGGATSIRYKFSLDNQLSHLENIYAK